MFLRRPAVCRRSLRGPEARRGAHDLLGSAHRVRRVDGEDLADNHSLATFISSLPSVGEQFNREGDAMAVAENTGEGLTELHKRVQLRRAVVASSVGSIIEAYDFLLYGQVTGLVFGKLYFPEFDPLVGTLQAFGIYAVGFASRPIGAAIFGHYG